MILKRRPPIAYKSMRFLFEKSVKRSKDNIDKVRAYQNGDMLYFDMLYGEIISLDVIRWILCASYSAPAIGDAENVAQKLLGYPAMQFWGISDKSDVFEIADE